MILKHFQHPPPLGFGYLCIVLPFINLILFHWTDFNGRTLITGFCFRIEFSFTVFNNPLCRCRGAGVGASMLLDPLDNVMTWGYIIPTFKDLICDDVFLLRLAGGGQKPHPPSSRSGESQPLPYKVCISCESDPYVLR